MKAVSNSVNGGRSWARSFSSLSYFIASQLLFLAMGILRVQSCSGQSGIWTLTGSLHTPRVNCTATLLPNGKVLVVGGTPLGDFHPIASAELYDPGTGNWSVTGSLNTGRLDHTATLLPNGKVLVAGGFRYEGTVTGMFIPLASSELYDPASGSWSVAASLNALHGLHTANLLPDGRLLLAA